MAPEYVIEGRVLRQADVEAQMHMLASRLPENADIAVHARDRLAFVVTLLACQQNQCRVLAAPSYWSAQRFADWLPNSPASAFVRRGSASHLEFMRLREQPSPATPGVVIFASGSSGTPKGVEHSWENAAASSGFTSERIREKNWYLAYEPAGYAGLQVIYAARATAGRLVMPPYGSGYSEHARLIVKHKVEVLSATPTWWRMLIASWPPGLQSPRLVQATLGGEIVDQGTLDQVVKFFEPAQVTHIYASSEAGTALAISDRRAGFPSHYLRDLCNLPERLRPVLPEHKMPRHIRFVEQLPVSANDKKQRH